MNEFPLNCYLEFLIKDEKSIDDELIMPELDSKICI